MKHRIMLLCDKCLELFREAYIVKIMKQDSIKGKCDGCGKKNIHGYMTRIDKK